jgi:hypothetical protein
VHRGHSLAVDIGYAYAVGIHQGEVAYAGAYKSLGTPASHAPHAEHYHTTTCRLLHEFGTQKPFGTVEYGIVLFHGDDGL